MVKVYVKDNNIEEAMRKFKRFVKKDGIVQEVKNREYFVKAGIKKRIKHEAAVREQQKKQRKLDKFNAKF